MSRPPEQIGDLIRKVLGDSPLREGLERQKALDCWPEVVGPEIARHSRAVAINEGTLLVRVDGAVWAQELALLKPRIVASFAERLGEGAVREIRFHSGRESL